MKIQTIKGKKGVSYRVQVMRNGERLNKTFKSKKLAERYLAMLTLDTELFGREVNPHLQVTLSEAVREYLGEYQGKDVNQGRRLAWWGAQMGSMALGKIKRAHVKQGLKALAGEGKADATLNRYKSSLHALYEYYREEYDTDVNPCAQVKSRKESDGIHDNLRSDEVQRLIEACRDSKWDRLLLLVLMAITTGARRSELLGLTWDEVDLGAQTVVFYDTKNEDDRVVVLTEPVIELLRAFQGQGGRLLFPHPRKAGEAFTSFDSHWYKALRQAGVTTRFHGLRHTCGSLMADQGVVMSLIAEHLGHRTIRSTKRYIKHSDRVKKQEVSRVFGKIA